MCIFYYFFINRSFKNQKLCENVKFVLRVIWDCLSGYMSRYQSQFFCRVMRIRVLRERVIRESTVQHCSFCLFVFTLSMRSGKREFKESSGKVFRTHALNQNHNFSMWTFSQKLHGVSSRGQKVRFFHFVRGEVDGSLFFLPKY